MAPGGNRTLPARVNWVTLSAVPVRDGHRMVSYVLSGGP